MAINILTYECMCVYLYAFLFQLVGYVNRFDGLMTAFLKVAAVLVPAECRFQWQSTGLVITSGMVIIPLNENSQSSEMHI